jgi:RNA polymerase sigma-70 factor (ECF subfamily)
MAPPEPLVGAALIARFLAAVAQSWPSAPGYERRRARVNGQPGVVMRGPAEPEFTDDQRQIARDLLARVASCELDATDLAAAVQRSWATTRDTGTPPARELRALSVLTIDVVGGRIQAVRIVRNPDKLRHL